MTNKITRHTFLKQSLQISALSMSLPTQILNLGEGHTPKRIPSEDDLFSRLVNTNDHQVTTLLASKNEEISRYSRRLGYEFGILSASYCSPLSRYYQSPEVATCLEKIIRFLLEEQRPDGTLNVGNFESPPDTAFLIELLCAGTSLLMENDSQALNDVKSDVKHFILKAGDALTTGGIHTPNHRWVICSALARTNALYPNEKYLHRIHDWLGEGIFIDDDGHYLERSRNYSEVVNRALITIARLLNMPSLLEPVRKNLAMTYYYMEPNGDLVTHDSRRQDQYAAKSIVAYYLHYRYLAILDTHREFAGITKLIEHFEGFAENVLNRSLVDFMEVPLLQQKLPESTPPPVDFEQFFTTTSLARIRREDTTTTIFGGVDWPLIIASGRSTSPNFFSFRKGEAVLKYMRLSSRFFSMGYFRSEGLKKDGNRYVLYQKLEVPYYQPLPQDKRKADGDYALSPSIDGRFWNKMAFEDRPTSNVKTLETTITIEEKNGSNEVRFQVTGQDEVAVTIELCFKEGGILSGVSPSEDGEDNYFLEEGTGQYQWGEDRIHFGPGILAHTYIRGLEGEKYSTHFGSLRTEGMHVYLTGITPFEHQLTFS